MPRVKLKDEKQETVKQVWCVDAEGFEEVAHVPYLCWLTDRLIKMQEQSSLF